MTPATPRIPPLADGEPNARQQEVIDDLVVGPTVNIYRTIARHPDAAAAMVNLGRTLRGGRLSPRQHASCSSSEPGGTASRRTSSRSTVGPGSRSA